MVVAKRYFFTFSFLFIQLALTPRGAAEDKGQFVTLKDNVSETQQQSEHHDLYVLAITWHARLAYNKERTDRYNERPWGADFGQSRQDDRGNWHGLYIMVFKGFYNKWEPIGSCGWEKIWRPLADENLHTGLGFTAGFTAYDNWNYIPVPVLLPLVSIGYGPATLQMTYIPGTYNNGNVYFAWMRFRF